MRIPEERADATDGRRGTKSMSRPHDKNTRHTLAWPPDSGMTGRISVTIDEMTVREQPFEGPGQAMVAAEIHIEVARQAAGPTGKAGSYIGAHIAFENAVIAKQCIHYSEVAQGRDGYDADEPTTQLIRAADDLISANTPKEQTRPNHARDLDIRELDLAIAEAEAHAAIVQAIAGRIADVPYDDLLAEELDSRETGSDYDDPAPLSPDEDRIYGLVRMAAYLGDPPKGRDTRIRYQDAYQETLEPLIESANRIIFAHELKIKEQIGEHAAQHRVDHWEMTDELHGLDDLYFDCHSCEEYCGARSAARHNGKDDILMAYMHNGVRYIQAATEPFPKGFPRERALEFTETIHESLADSDPMLPMNERSFWRILHDLHGAITVGVHDIDPVAVEIVQQDIAGGKPAKGLRQHVIHALALDNLHAARFLASATIETTRMSPTEQQVKEVIEAAQKSGMDSHQVAYLAEALYRDPPTLGVIRPAASEDIIQEVKENLMNLPAANNYHLARQLTNP